MSQVELQRTIERFTGKFIEDMTAAADALPRTDSDQQQDALRRVLQYASTALDIASGPIPEVNVLDMLVFVTLSRRALEASWLTELLGEGGHALIVVFAEFERQLWEISDRVLDGPQQHQLRELIRAWTAANPGEARVEWVRFEDVTSRGAELSQEHARNARSLMRSIRSAGQNAGDALLLGERALFVTRRLPSLLRLQARVCAQEMISDLGKLRTARGQFAAEPELHPLDRVLRRCMSTLGGALLGWLLPRESRGAIASAGVQPRVEEA